MVFHTFRCLICPKRGDVSNNIRADKVERSIFELLKYRVVNI